MARQNTRLEWEGAEFLVLGQLLIEGITAYNAYTNMLGYDIIALNPSRRKHAHISVKSRWHTKADGFIIKNYDCDFVVVVKLNRGSKKGGMEKEAPAYYVFSIQDVIDFKPTKNWGKVLFRKIPKLEDYRDDWDRIRKFLHGEESHL